MVQGTLSIHTENILPIIKKWLYSDKDIFVRELISNSCDAIAKCRVLQEQGKMECDLSSFRIDLKVDKEKKELVFEDNGIGMTAAEVEKYIAQIAFSGAEEFVSTYKSKEEKDQIIGHFGLGFYSAYMVSSLVTIETLSFQEGAKPCQWTCDGSTSYTLDEGSRKERGTAIVLKIDQDSEEFLDEHRLRAVLQRHCAFLPVPIYLNGSQINKKEPLYLKNSSECTEQDYLEFYRALYPFQPDPMFWMHINVDYPFNVKGILYFPKIHKQFDFSNNAIKLFCNRVFVSENCKDLIPEYLMILQGAIDSPDIPLNVSRSTLQMDRTVRQLSSHIAKKVSDRLQALYAADKEKFVSFWPSIELIIKLGILQDEKFYDKVKECLVFKSVKGEWMTPSDYLASFREKTKGKIFYVTEDQKESPLLSLYEKQGIDVLIAASPVDAPLMSFLEDKLEDAHFQRIDGALHDHLIDASRESTLLDAEGKTESAKIASCIQRELASVGSIEVEAKSLKEDGTAALLVIDEEMRRMHEALALSRQSFPGSQGIKKTFVVNTNSPLIRSIVELQEKDPALAKDLTQHLYELASLSQRQLDPSSFPGFVIRATSLLEKLGALAKNQ